MASIRLGLESLDDRCVPSAAGRYAVGSGTGGPPRVQVYDTGTGQKVVDFLAFESTFTGGVTTAFGDVNNDGFPDLIVGAGQGGGPRVRIFNGALLTSGFNPGAPGSVIADFFAYEDSQRGGVFVAAGNFDGTLNSSVVVGAGPGGGPRVRILSGQSITTQGVLFTSFGPTDRIADFFAYESTFRNGVTVAANPVPGISGFSDLVTAPGLGGSPRVRVLSGVAINGGRTAFTSFGTNDTIADFFSGDPNSRSGLFVASADVSGDGLGDIITGTGPGLPGLVTVYDGAAVRNKRLTFNGGAPGDVVNQFAPLPGYSNGVTVGTTLNTGGGAANLLHGVGGFGAVGDSVLSRFTPFNGTFSRTVVFDHVFDPAQFTGVNVSN
jgi:hypothetical protein